MSDAMQDKTESFERIVAAESDLKMLETDELVKKAAYQLAKAKRVQAEQTVRKVIQDEKTPGLFNQPAEQLKEQGAEAAKTEPETEKPKRSKKKPDEPAAKVEYQHREVAGGEEWKAVLIDTLNDVSDKDARAAETGGVSNLGDWAKMTDRRKELVVEQTGKAGFARIEKAVQAYLAARHAEQATATAAPIDESMPPEVPAEPESEAAS